MKAYVFPGQAAQFVGMGKDLYDTSDMARELFERADDLLGFRITDFMFGGTEEDLKRTKVTQPAVFLQSVIKAKANGLSIGDSVLAGHSLGEFSALVVGGALEFEAGLELVNKRAVAMQKACEKTESTMAAIIGLDDETVEQICSSIDELVVPANYNCPGQLVISGTIKGIESAVEKMKEAGAKRAIMLPVGGAFHSPLMAPAKEELRQAIEDTDFRRPAGPIYQNVNATAVEDPEVIQSNLIEQLTAPVLWTQIMQNMIKDGVREFVEVGGTGKVLQGFVKRIDRKFPTSAL